MCLTPITIRNPNYGLHIRGEPLIAEYGDLFFLKDRVNSKLSIPCGHCSQCIGIKQLNLVQRVLMESLVNEVFFVTMTYNNATLPLLHVNDYDIRYADYQDVIHMFKRLKKYNTLKYPFRYFGVSELGSKRGRPHFHLLLFINKQYFDDYNDKISYQEYLKKTLLENWTRNTGSTRSPVYVPLCTYAERFIANKWRRNFDVQYCSPAQSENGVADVAFYCLKYMLKRNEREIRLQQALRLNLDPKLYAEDWSILRCRSFYSTGFGLSPVSALKVKMQDIVPDPIIVEYLRNCISRSIDARSPYPCFYHPNTGDTFPLARYYWGKPEILTLKDQYAFYHINYPEGGDPNYEKETLAYSEYLAKLDTASRRLKDIHFSNDDYLNDLCQ